AILMWRSAPVTAPPTPVEDGEAEPPGGAPNPPVGSGGGAPETGAPLTETAGESSAPTFWRRARWVSLTFVPSSLMLGVTAFITTNITPIPLLWVIPLSLYLLSFTIVFSPFQRVPDIVHKVMVGALPVLMTTLVLTALTDLRRPYWALILLHLLGFFVVAMVLHGEVARDRPAARHLTEFYLWVAVGGVLGGLFNALIAPVAFDTVVEYPLAIVLACLFVPGAILARLLTRRPEERQGEDDSQGEERETITSSGSRTLGSRQLALVLDFALPVALGLVILAFGWLVDWGYFDPIMERYNVWQIFIGLSAAVCLWFAYASSRPIRFGLGIAALLIAVTFANGVGNVLFEDRSFFGVYRVSGDAGTEQNAYHALVVGDTNHGAQLFGSQPPTPIAYHDPSGPFGQLFELLPSEATDESPVAVLGLGAGVMSCYAEPGQRWTYYEIDPLVERIARNENLFTYLRDCPGEYDVEIGDARLKLSEAEAGSYGMVIGEAFSSDAIPVHMLTREATEMYFEKLNENGVLVHHISNRLLELEPVVGDLARDRGLTCYQSYDDLSDTTPSATSQYKLAAHFTVLARDEADLGSVPDDPRWSPCQTNAETDKVWTDDYSNILSTFAFE
ncbi:MAG TPA: fused MFS/spermidine synthase, partial [Rubrobacter sp.]|nr:fused MFS/spermidine synthase [Rubrobacter sp.]